MWFPVRYQSLNALSGTSAVAFMIASKGDVT